MAKKMILLILVVPLVLMITLFNTTKGIALAVDVAVNKIEITNDKLVYLNMDEGNTHQIDYTVYPTNAQNQKVTYEVEALPDTDLADLLIKDGMIRPLSSGSAKVIVKTIDGSYTDSIIVCVISEYLKSIDLTTKSDLSSVYIGDSLQFSCLFNPFTAINQAVDYSSSDPNIMQISPSGKALAVSKGKVTIKAVSRENSSIYAKKTFEIMAKDLLDLSLTTYKTTKKDLTIYATVSTLEEYTIDYLYDENLVESFIVENVSSQIKRINISVKDSTVNFVFNVALRTASSEEMTKSCQIMIVDNIEEIDIEASQFYFTKGMIKQIPLNVIPNDVFIDYEINYDQGSITALLEDNVLNVSALQFGKTIVTIKALIRGAVYKELEVTFIVGPRNITINNLVNTYGIAKELAVGNYDIEDGLFVNSNYVFQYTTDADVTDDLKTQYYRYISSDNSIAEVSNGILKIKKDGLITLSIAYVIDGIVYKESKMNVRCVYEGVNVYSYAHLMKTVNSERAVVLHQDIIEDFGVGYAETYREIETTYDWTYYENIYRIKKDIPMETPLTAAQIEEACPKVKVLVHFKNDVYGNGKIINSGKIANKVDSTGSIVNSLFKGPLNFVAMTGEGASSLSVKAQDNISFLVDSNVTINNIVLKSANEVDDLTKLDYVGTTVEIMGDNVAILNSRLMNGRTVLRAFGTTNPDEIIHVRIESCILNYAREFIMRLGSNKWSDGVGNLAGLTDNAVKEFNFDQNQSLYRLNSSSKISYEENYIANFVSVKNCVLEKCGIFSIGLDAHFGGGLLDSGYIQGWVNCAKTSYGVKLSLVDDVRIYDWKKINDVDSSTLIENIGMASSYGSFDIKKMIEELSVMKKNGVYPYESIKCGDYVHGGIAFFGGGKNYSVVDFSDYTGIDFGCPSSSEYYYAINLNDCEDTAKLTLAAGNNDFRFYLYDNNSIRFTPTKQINDVTNGTAYSWIPVANI